MLEINLIRHAPTDAAGRLIGRSDLRAVLPQGPAPRLPVPEILWCSPARRCRETADWLWPKAVLQLDPGFWEQDFGAWEGKAYAELPDLGPLPRAALARHHAPGGESFLDLAGRVEGSLSRLPESGAVTLVAHAGVIRAALGLALGDVAAGLAFAIDPLSETRLLRSAAGWAIVTVNRPLLPSVQPPEAP